MVCSFATTSTLRPDLAAVFAVTGPMQAIMVSFKTFQSVPSMVIKLHTVDELVKVTMSIFPFKSISFPPEAAS